MSQNATRTLIELSDRIALDPAAIQVAAAHKNVRSWTCQETGKTYDAQLRIETYHDVYRVPFSSIGEAVAVLRIVLAAMRAANDAQRVPAGSAPAPKAHEPAMPALAHPGRAGSRNAPEKTEAVS